MTEYRLIIATDLTEESLALLRAAGDVTFSLVPPSGPALREQLQEAHALICREDVPVDRTLLEQAPRLRLVARMTASLGGVDIEHATARGIIVMHTPGVSAIAVGEHTLALMLALSRRLTTAHNSLRDGYWLLDRKRQAGTQLYRKTLGIIGLGRVGHIVALRALAFGMQVLACDPYISEDKVTDERIELVSLRELLTASDFISLHVPATRETRHLLNEQSLASLKPGARLINTAHGSLIDEAALVQALKSGQVGGAAVDVYAEEPPYNSPLVGLPGVIHTPRISDNTAEATQDLALRVVEQVLDALRDKDYRNVVNMPLLPGLNYETVRPYLHLGEAMGSLLHTLARHRVRRVAVEVRGEAMNGLIRPLSVAILRGLIAPVLGDKVSYINAPMLAAEFGWHIHQVKGLKTGEYSNIVTCQITLEDGEPITMTGTLLDHKEPHIVQINEYRMNFVPEGALLILGSHDKPGVIGRVGSLLSGHQVNIASWHTGRAQPGGHTLTVVTLDEELPAPVLEELRQLDFIRHAHQVTIARS
ncbi:MAG: phosphoglycerate dehydrogenase [Anaerolineae bacterium]|nr:phosphoglycerate dehydrogenase [Anaerolineae bacterium]